MSNQKKVNAKHIWQRINTFKTPNNWMCQRTQEGEKDEQGIVEIQMNEKQMK